MASATNRVEEEVNGDSDELQDADKSQKKSAKHDSGASDLEKVTDFMEEKEIRPTEFFQGVCLFISLSMNAATNIYSVHYFLPFSFAYVEFSMVSVCVY